MAINVKKANTPAAAPQAAKAGTTTPSWAKRGQAAQADMEKYEKEAEAHYAALNRMWRFFLKKGESAPITFVDGNLLPDGTLDLMTYREHTVEMAPDDWQNFVCIAESEPCPICEGGNFPALVGVLTIIDHRKFQGKKGIITDRPKLYVAKKGTIKLLQHEATKRGGLAGCRFEVSRLGDKDPNVGGNLSFEEKSSVVACQKKYVRKGKDGKIETVFVPANYEQEIEYLTGKELRAKGFGAGKVIGSETAADAEAAGAEAGKHL